MVPEPTGGAILIVGTLKYPFPGLVITKPSIVPVAETSAVAAAPTFIWPDVISASTSLILILYFSSDKSSTWGAGSIWSPFS